MPSETRTLSTSCNQVATERPAGWDKTPTSWKFCGSATGPNRKVKAMEGWEPTGQRQQGNLQQMLDGLQADYASGASVKFPALGWVVYVNAEGPDLYRARLMNDGGELLVDDKFTAQALGAYISATLTLERRRVVILGALAVAEAEKLLA
jgi:hypothetical protein